MLSPRTLAALWAAKAAGLTSRRLGRGGGTALAGLVGLQLQPGMIRELAENIGLGSVFVTGTNGKTTTSRLISETVRAGGLVPLANASGSNLLRGIASALSTATTPAGVMASSDRRLGVFETDEAALPLLLKEIRPRAIVFLNLFRDQLDRYGEVEALASRWREAISGLPDDVVLVLNADDPAVASLGEGRVQTLYFGLDDSAIGVDQIEHASDSLYCRCGAPLRHDAIYFGHLSHWRCTGCERERPALDLTAEDIDLRDGRSASFKLVPDQDDASIELALGGLYNIYNALAALATAKALGLPFASSIQALNSTPAAFGRQESFDIDEKRVDLFLGKNPAGLNQVLATLNLDPGRRVLMLALNDEIADGRDISWIWDVDFEKSAGRFNAVITSGTRAADMALRLKYADYDEATIGVESGIEAGLNRALDVLAPGETLAVVPTYTAMLKVRELLAGRSGRDPFWRVE